ncbi:MAG TPA: hypothetical protein IAA29_00735 [Candidatus Paenibacillus intestinavium]|nr:hypothetical protein [Candidatus Paenibacillus intestinavium]
MTIKHDIKPERLDRFVSSPKGLKIEFPNGDKMKVAEVEDGNFELIKDDDK